MQDNHTLANLLSNNMQDNHSTGSKKAFRNRNIIGMLTLLLPLVLAAQSVRLNEFMALNNSTITDADGEYSDWIEIFNPTTATVSLENWSLTDDRNIPQKWLLPAVSIAADSYLVIFASGKDRRDPAQELHTNFKLSGDGEYLTLIDSAGNSVSTFDPAFPAQQSDISWAFFDGDYFATTIPTPGSANQLGTGQILPAPTFSQSHGFYDSPFEVAITSTVSGVAIYYTTNGDTPDSQNGLLYTEPISITTTTVLRAIAVKSEKLTSSVSTVTYLFLKDVINQPNDPPGYPAEWGPYYELTGNSTADYEMDPDITQNPEYANLMDDALLALPTISIVTDISNLFSHSTDPNSGGIYIYTGPPGAGDVRGLGDNWERPASAEYFNADGSESFQINCGVRLHGGHSRRPEKCPKHSFRLVFRNEYGSTRLNYPIFGNSAPSSFHSFILRAGFGNTWNHWRHAERIRAQLIRDVWGKDTQLALSELSGHGSYVHLYLNGIYWGVFNLTERLDNDFCVTYLGGNEADWDVIKFHTSASEVVVVDGNLKAWNELFVLARKGLTDNANYQRLQGNNPDGTPNPNYPAYLDVVNFIDYMLINFYGSNWDWDHHNGIVVRNRVNPGKGFKFLSWDAEHILENINDNFLDEKNPNCPSELFQLLRQNEDFCRLLANRVQFLCFNGGVLTPESAAERYLLRAEQLDLPIIAESARWGDYRRDVHPYQSNDTYWLYTKDHWLDELSFLVDTYFPQRTNVFLSQLRQVKLFPSAQAPQFAINDQPVTLNQNTIAAGATLSMTVPAGAIYYTTNGSDPVAFEPAVDPDQITLVAEDAAKKVLVPKSDIGTSWRSDINYDVSGWQSCSGAPGGIGYERASGYANLITLNVNTDMSSNNSCYVRNLFNLSSEDLSKIKSLSLNVRFDDGFVAYLNGVKVAASNAPTAPSWNSAAPDGVESTGPQAFDISNYISDLVAGENLLAVQALNAATTSSDFLINFQIVGSENTVSNSQLSAGAVEYTAPLQLTQSTYVKARNYQNNEWSALREVIFSVPSEIYNLKITEIHYHPLTEDALDDRCFEFVEIQNCGDSPLDLSGVKFTDGITYTFPAATILLPKAYLVLAADQTYFTQRYGFPAFAEYQGSLNNAGEQIVMTTANDDTLIAMQFDDHTPWPVLADGQGYSLVAINPETDLNDPTNWRISLLLHGSPGRDDRMSKLTDEPSEIRPSHFDLSQNYPNPFNPITSIAFKIAADTQVRLQIYNIRGERVAMPVNQKLAVGNYAIHWDASRFPSGIYFYVLNAGNFTDVKKMMLLK